VSSDLQRAHDTARSLAHITGLQIHQHKGLRETGAGEWEGLYQHELLARYPEDIRTWMLGGDIAPGRTGEPRTVVAARMVAAIEELLIDVPEDGVLVVTTHGGAARAATGALLGLPVEYWAAFGGLANAAWTVLSEPHPKFSPPGAWDANTVSEQGTKRKSGPWRLIEYNAGSLPEPVIGDDR